MILFIFWFITFGLGWIFLIFFRKNRDVMFHRFSMLMFFIALIISVVKIIQLIVL